MTGRAYWRPRARAYPFNYSYYLRDYKPITSTTTTYTYKEISPPPVEKPGRLALADRPSRSLSREGSVYRSAREGSLYRSSREGSLYRSSRERSVLPREGSVYRYRASSAPPPSTRIADEITSLKARLRASEAPDYDLKYRDTLRRFYHPYRLPIEDEVMPLSEDSIWPEGRKHFDLVSSYDLMCGFLGLRP
ncbi:uncharacterized protein [Panulirus ornatus]|uniref:uncharacterized protein isoform X2 n=1 Tax=Panulirus ornatus TaxID=150431 RepID=UPI003A882EB1